MIVYRYLERESYAEDLRQGYVWLSTLGDCRKHEGSRGDAGEAVHTHAISSMTVSTSSSSPQELAAVNRLGMFFESSEGIVVADCHGEETLADAYVLCFTTAERDARHRERFGKHAIRVSDAARFGCAVARALCKEARPLRLQHGPVQYGPRDTVDTGLPPGPLGFVKPHDFRWESEYRFIFQVRQPRYVYRSRKLLVPGASRLCARHLATAEGAT